MSAGGEVKTAGGEIRPGGEVRLAVDWVRPGGMFWQIEAGTD